MTDPLVEALKWALVFVPDSLGDSNPGVRKKLDEIQALIRQRESELPDLVPVTADECAARYGRSSVYFRTAGQLGYLKVFSMMPYTFDEREVDRFVRQLTPEIVLKLNRELKRKKTPASLEKRPGRRPGTGLLFKGGPKVSAPARVASGGSFSSPEGRKP